MSDFSRWPSPYGVEMVHTESPPVPIKDAILDPPMWTRLEPQSRSGDPRPGVEARVHDPLWLLARQWQLGQLRGEDAGTPVSVTVRTESLPVTAWHPGGTRLDDPGGWRPWPTHGLLDPLVEGEPAAGRPPGIRRRAEAGAQLLALLEEAGAGELRDVLLEAYPLSLRDDVGAGLDAAATRLLSVLSGEVPDGSAVFADVVGRNAWWLREAEDVAGAAVDEWLRWYRGAEDADDAWVTERLEYRFALRFGAGDDQVIVHAPAFGGGRAEWSDFEYLPGARVGLPGDGNRRGPRTEELTVLATPLRFAGMPTDRYWELEDGGVDFGAIEAQPHDLARMCLAEFALAFGDDWLVVPVDTTTGTVCSVREVSYTTTFGERVVVPKGHSDDPAEIFRFRLFEVVTADGKSTLDGLVLPPVAPGRIDGEPVEEVVLMRDEAANMAWAVERIVPGASGDPRDRGNEPATPEPEVGEVKPGDLVYRLMTAVPRNWIPLVPVSTGYGQVALRKGAFDDADGQPILPVGHLLHPTPLTFPDEEIPREGLRVRRVPSLARRADGEYVRWMARRVSVGRAGWPSGLVSDATRPPR